MNEEAALLAAVCDTPADDTARLVFADYLQEQGGNVHGAWALFIRGQIELARRAEGEPGDPVTEARVRVLDVPFWRAQWFARLGFGDTKVTCREWVRGFPVSVSGEARALRAVWPNLAVRVPFEKLKVTNVTDADIEDLVTRPALERVRELSLESEYYRDVLGDRAILALAGCAALRALRELTACYAVLSDVAAEAVLDSPHLANLRSFSTRVGYRHCDTIALSADVRERFEQRFDPRSINRERYD